MHKSVFVVMPVHGRQEQSVDTMRRLIGTAHYPATYLSVGGYADANIVNTVGSVAGCQPILVNTLVATYWQSLHRATAGLSDDALIVNVANDVLPCHQWLQRAVDDYRSEADKYNNPYDPVIGFNGDGHLEEHACHFMISMERIRSYGGWPTWYHHNFGDTEIVQRAESTGDFYKSKYAILFHNHPYVSGAPSDAVYAEGNSKFQDDRRLFLYRKERGWDPSLIRLP
jgi:hypothetical protein